MAHQSADEAELMARLARYPDLRPVLLELLRMADAGEGRFDDAERRVVELVRKTGNAALMQWASSALRRADEETVQVRVPGLEKHSKKNG